MIILVSFIFIENQEKIARNARDVARPIIY